MIEKKCKKIHGMTVFSNDGKTCYYAHKDKDQRCTECEFQKKED